MVVTVALAASLAACGAESEVEEGPGGETPTCPRGQTWDGEQCVNRPGGGDTPDVGPGGGDEDTTDDTGETPSPDGGDPPGPVSCEPFTTTCLNSVAVGRCNGTGDGYTEEPCVEGRACSEGVCALAAVECTPGGVSGCGSPTAQRICNAAGDAFDNVACPTEAPTCRAGACTDQFCEPGSRQCDGDQVQQCNAEGRSFAFVETCDGACSAGECIDPCSGDGKSYVGCGFWAVDLDQYAVPCTSNAQCGPGGGTCSGGYCSGSNARGTPFAVTISNPGDAPVDAIAYNATGTEIARVVVPPNDLVSIQLPDATFDNTSLSFDAIRIETSGPVTAHQFNPATNVGAFSNDASLLLPITALGTEYIGIGWPSEASETFKNYVAIVAVSPGSTTVTVTAPRSTGIAPGPGGTPAGIPAGGTQTYTLTEGQLLNLSTAGGENQDLTGIQITATQPVSVFSGTECSNVPRGVGFCDHMEQQLFPVDTWGAEFIGAKFNPRGGEDDLWRIVASVDGTLIRTQPPITNVDGRTLNRGEFIEFRTRANQNGNTGGDFLVAGTQPIMVAQFMAGSQYPTNGRGTCNRGPFGDSGCAIPRSCDSGSGVGDPAMVLNVPTDQFREDYIVLTPAQYQRNFLTVVARFGSRITVDGNPIPATNSVIAGWGIHRMPVAEGVHIVRGDQPFGLYAYGYDCDVSYAYPGGLNLDTLRGGP
jgi:hypothetical protein